MFAMTIITMGMIHGMANTIVISMGMNARYSSECKSKKQQ